MPPHTRMWRRKVEFSWAFIFRMGVKVDEHEMAIKTQYLDEDPIPLEAWQLCSRLWKFDFTISHAFSRLGDKLIIMIGQKTVSFPPPFM
jgi:hypothetical protein